MISTGNLLKLWVLCCLIFLVSTHLISSQEVQPLLSPYHITAIKWSPDGTKIAGAGVNGFLKIWDAETGIIIQDFQGIERAVNSVAWSPDGTKVASGGDDMIIRIWDITGTLLTTIDTHTAIITSVAWNSDGTLLASATHAGLEQYSLRIWDGNNYQPLVATNAGQVNAIAWNPDPNKSEIASVGENGWVSIYAVTSLDIQYLRGHRGEVASRAIGWNSDGSKLASGDDNGNIYVWNPETFDNNHTLNGHTSYSYALTWSPDDTQLASASADGTIRIWNTTNEQQVGLFSNEKLTFTTSIDWNSNGLIFGKSDGIVKIIQFPTASAGDDQTVTTTTVTLDGSGSSDPDGTIVSYSWSIEGEEIAKGISPQVELSEGTHNIKLTVTDDDGATARDEVIVRVEK